MTNQNSTSSASAATLTEQELWIQFATMTVERRDNLSGTVDTYQVEHLVADCGEYGWIVDFSRHVAADIADSDAPEETLEAWITDIRCYLTSLERVSADFLRLKEAHHIVPDEPEDDAGSEAYSAWERAAVDADENPRYRCPAVATEARKAA